MNTTQIGRQRQQEHIAIGLFLCGLSLLIAGCGGSSSQTSPPHMQTYSIIDLGALPGGASSSATALNSKGQVVGLASNGSSSHAFLWQNNQMTDLGTLPGGSFSQATGINDNGQICGSSDSSVKDSQGLPISHAFLYSGGALADLGVLAGDVSSGASALSADGTVVGFSVPPFTSSPNPVGLTPSHAVQFHSGSVVNLGKLPADTDSIASGINISGQIVGMSFAISKSVPHAFLYSNGTLVPLGALPGDIGSSATAINITSEAVGYSKTDAGPGNQGREIYHNHAVVFMNGHVTSLGLLPGDTDSEADAINDSGQIVGVSENSALSDPAKSRHPFVWQQGQLVDLTSRLVSGSGWTLTSVTGINNAGQICGTGQHNGVTRAFLLMPQ